ncbi:MAG: hypothetical protein ACFFD2_15275 [Promethearchaeota archaeon]
MPVTMFLTFRTVKSLTAGSETCGAFQSTYIFQGYVAPPSARPWVVTETNQAGSK